MQWHSKVVNTAVYVLPQSKNMRLSLIEDYILPLTVRVNDVCGDLSRVYVLHWRCVPSDPCDAIWYKAG